MDTLDAKFILLSTVGLFVCATMGGLLVYLSAIIAPVFTNFIMAEAALWMILYCLVLMYKCKPLSNFTDFFLVICTCVLIVIFGEALHSHLLNFQNSIPVEPKISFYNIFKLSLILCIAYAATAIIVAICAKEPEAISQPEPISKASIKWSYYWAKEVKDIKHKTRHDYQLPFRAEGGEHT